MSITRIDLEGDPVLVAPTLLGAHLHVIDGSATERIGRIVEVEAYKGEADPASHAFRGPTPRTQVMFGEAGHLYVYRSYGMHWCANIVCGPLGTAAAVLVRAIEPIGGRAAMYEDRPKAKQDRDLGSGPGKVCAALGMTGADGGADLLAAPSGRIWLCAGNVPSEPIVCGPRVGISVATTRPWRFWLDGNPHVSYPRRPNINPTSPH